MGKKNKKLDIDKAIKLAFIYKEKRHYAKQQFIEELIEFQNFFGDTSIIGCQLALNRRYHRKSIESVLNDLGYELYYFESTNLKTNHYTSNDISQYSSIAFRTKRE